MAPPKKTLQQRIEAHLRGKSEGYRDGFLVRVTGYTSDLSGTRLLSPEEIEYYNDFVQGRRMASTFLSKLKRE